MHRIFYVRMRAHLKPAMALKASFKNRIYPARSCFSSSLAFYSLHFLQPAYLCIRCKILRKFKLKITQVLDLAYSLKNEFMLQPVLRRQTVDSFGKNWNPLLAAAPLKLSFNCACICQNLLSGHLSNNEVGWSCVAVWEVLIGCGF